MPKCQLWDKIVMIIWTCSVTMESFHQCHCSGPPQPWSWTWPTIITKSTSQTTFLVSLASPSWENPSGSTADFPGEAKSSKLVRLRMPVLESRQLRGTPSVCNGSTSTTWCCPSPSRVWQCSWWLPSCAGTPSSTTPRGSVLVSSYPWSSWPTSSREESNSPCSPGSVLSTASPCTWWPRPGTTSRNTSQSNTSILWSATSW